MDADILRRGLVYQISAMGSARVQRDQIYRHVEPTPLTMDIYHPAQLAAGARLPAICFIHGGPIPADLPLAPKDWGIYRDYGELAAAHGLIGITFNHRYHGYDRLATAASDIEAAIASVRERADDFQLDPDRICLWAFSGGGPFLGPPLRDRPAHIRCLVAYYALLDLQPLAPSLADGLSEATQRQFSPLAALQQLPASQVPVLIARAGKDRPALNATIDAFAAAALAANLPLDLLNHPEGQHGFDILDDDRRSRAIIAHTIGSVRQYLTADDPLQ